MTWNNLVDLGQNLRFQVACLKIGNPDSVVNQKWLSQLNFVLKLFKIWIFVLYIKEILMIFVSVSCPRTFKIFFWIFKAYWPSLRGK